MSTIVAQTLSNGTVSTSTANCIRGSARAWVNFNGTAGTIMASYNVSSITVNATADYSVNFTNAFSDANYSACGLTDNGNTNAFWVKPVTYSAENFRFIAGNTTNNYTATTATLSVFR